MRSRPTVPTAALAALISGNHRHFANRSAAASASGRMSAGDMPLPTEYPVTPEIDLQRAVRLPQPDVSVPFAVIITPDLSAAEVATAFDMSEGGFVHIALSEGPRAVELFADLERAIDAPGVVLVVVLSQLAAPVRTVGTDAFAECERHTFGTLGRVIDASAGVRLRLGLRQLRAVAALLDPSTGRVHWLGEHPEQARILREHPRVS